ncbi:chaplin family protein [Nocardiopsis baichengensis]|uniref:chaplin family protein n=1 Tax=Nocardiopsis baichengensis TaxID=280240 RepID=UPI0003481971|nr:chaplin family protein [Nocardiopsis baichengensis]
MRKRLTTTTTLALLTAGFAGAPFAAAWADPVTDGSGGVASGNQINVPADVEADICGNALSVLGISKAQCTEVSKTLYAASDEGSASPKTDGSGGVASGNQINIPVDAALDVCGNSAAVGGVSKADCTKVVKELAEESDGSASPKTDGSGGVASGNQINIPVDAAISVCGNSVAVLGTSESECTTVINYITSSPDNEDAPETDGSGGVASGNQINIPVDAAVEICGNAVSVLGVAKAECMEKVGHEDGGDGGDGSDGDDGSDGGDGSDGDDGSDGGDGGDGGKDDDKDEQKDDGGDGGKDDDKGEGGEDDSSTGGGQDGGDEKKAAAEEDDLLPVTGTALGGMVAAAVAAVGAGAGAMALARKKRRAAAAHAAE